MTATITLSCPTGIIMATDRRCSYRKGIKEYDFEENSDKLYLFSKVPIGVSCWGAASLDSGTIIDYLETFEKQELENKDDVNSISKKLKKTLEELLPEIKESMGLHIAGYCFDGKDNYPQIRHVFREFRLKQGQFVNEDSNREYHNKNGSIKQFNYDPFIALYNGDRAIAIAIFSYLHKIYPNKQRIILDKLNLMQCADLAKLIINLSGEILNYLTTLDTSVPVKAVKGLMLAEITLKGSKRLDRTYYAK